MQSKLSDKKINTLVELRMQEIARKEARKLNPSLCLRRYCWVDYDPMTNKFLDLATATTNKFDWDGQVINLTDKILKVDQATIVNTAIADDENTQAVESVIRAADGANIITSIKNAHGRRTGDQISLTGWSLNHRITCDFTDLATENLYDKIDLHIGLVKVRRRYLLEDEAQAHIPYQAKELLKINPWGYNSAIDAQTEHNINYHVPGVTTLFRTKVTVSNSSSKHNNILFKNFSGKFSKPIKIDYAIDDIQATSANYDIYLVIRSTVASTGNANDVQSEPYCQTCAKLYYVNN